MNLANIDWAIVGGESGRKARPMKEKWVWDIKQQCQEQEVAFFFKQWGGVNKKKSGRMLAGQTYDEMPTRDLLFIAPFTNSIVDERVNKKKIEYSYDETACLPKVSKEV